MVRHMWNFHDLFEKIFLSKKSNKKNNEINIIFFRSCALKFRQILAKFVTVCIKHLCYLIR